MKTLKASNYIFVIFIAVLLTGTSAFSQATYEKPLIFPYRGVLEINGEPYNGNITMRFTIDDENPVSRDAENYLWQQEQDIEIIQGQFYTTLGGGEENPFTYLAFEDENTELNYMDDLYIGVDIDNRNGFVELSNSQKIVPLLSAYMTTLGEHLYVNELRTSYVIANNNISVPSSDSIESDNEGNLTGGGLTIGNPDGNNNKMLLGRNRLETSSRPLKINELSGEDVHVYSDLTVEGAATIVSDLTVEGAATIVSDLTVEGVATIASNLTLSGNVFALHDLNVSGDLTVSGEIKAPEDEQLIVNIGLKWTNWRDPADEHITGDNINIYTYTSHCPSNKKVVSGSCNCWTGGENRLVMSIPESDSAWVCGCKYHNDLPNGQRMRLLCASATLFD